MNWNHLYCFYEVAKVKSVKLAAQSMGLASSTVSEHVKKLEATQELSLFTRSGRELLLTSDGERIYAYAKEMFDTGLRLLDSLDYNDVGGYSVKVSIENHLENSSLDEFLVNYWDAYSSFGIVETKRSKNLAQTIYFLENDVTDLAITSTTLEDERFDKLKIGEFSYDFYCSPEHNLDPGDKREILKTLPLGSYGESEKLSSEIKNFLISNKISVKEQFHSDHFDLLFSLCLKGRINLVLPSLNDYKMKDLKKLNFKESISFPLFIMFKKSNSQLLFIRKLIELMANLNIQTNDLSSYKFHNKDRNQ